MLKMLICERESVMGVRFKTYPNGRLRILFKIYKYELEYRFYLVSLINDLKQLIRALISLDVVFCAW